MKKSFFDIEFQPDIQPGHQTRNLSNDVAIGKTLKTKLPKVEAGSKGVGPIKKQTSAREQYGSGQVKELLPSVILRKKGRV